MTPNAKPAPSTSRIRDLFRKRSVTTAVPLDQLLREENGHLLREVIEKVLESLPHHHPNHLCTSASTQTDQVAPARYRSASAQTLAEEPSLAVSHQAVQTCPSDDEHEVNDDDYDGDDDDDGDDKDASEHILVCKLESLLVAPKPHNNTLSHILVNYTSSPTVESDPRRYQKTTSAKPIQIRTRHGIQIPWRDKYIRIRLPPTPKPLPRVVPLRTASQKPTASSLFSDISQPRLLVISDNDDLITLDPSMPKGTMTSEVGPHGFTETDSVNSAQAALANRHLPGPPDSANGQSGWQSKAESHVFGSQQMDDIPFHFAAPLTQDKAMPVCIHQHPLLDECP